MHLSLARWIVPVSCIALLVPVLASARVSDATTGLSASGRAAGLSSACSSSATACIATLLGRVLNILFGFLGIILLGYILYGGFVWMTASGSKDVDQAQTIIRNAVIGVVIIACSFAISNFVLARLGEIAGVGGTGSSATAPDGTSGSGNPTVDEVRDGALRLCCYANPLPMATCLRDCQQSPTAFGLTTSATTQACTTACNARICTGGTPADPRPVTGQLQCSLALLNPGPSTPTPTYDREALCRSLDVEAGVLSPTRDACRICSNGCLADMCRGTRPAGWTGTIPPLSSQANADAARTLCELGPCATACRI